MSDSFFVFFKNVFSGVFAGRTPPPLFFCHSTFFPPCGRTAEKKSARKWPYFAHIRGQKIVGKKKESQPSSPSVELDAVIRVDSSPYVHARLGSTKLCGGCWSYWSRLAFRPLGVFSGKTAPKHAAELHGCPCRPRASQNVGGSGAGLGKVKPQRLRHAKNGLKR